MVCEKRRGEKDRGEKGEREERERRERGRNERGVLRVPDDLHVSSVCFPTLSHPSWNNSPLRRELVNEDTCRFLPHRCVIEDAMEGNTFSDRESEIQVLLTHTHTHTHTHSDTQTFSLPLWLPLRLWFMVIGALAAEKGDRGRQEMVLSCCSTFGMDHTSEVILADASRSHIFLHCRYGAPNWLSQCIKCRDEEGLSSAHF